MAQICTKSFVRWGFAPDPTGGAYSAPPDPLAGFRGPTSKAPTSKGRGGEGRKPPHELKPNSAHDNKRKRLRNSGSSYVSKKNKWCKARNVKVLESHDACRKKCSEKVSEAQRATLFSGFWKLGDFDAQNVFLSRSV